jgi:hypothetical protein
VRLTYYYLIIITPVGSRVNKSDRSSVTNQTSRKKRSNTYSDLLPEHESTYQGTYRIQQPLHVFLTDPSFYQVFKFRVALIFSFFFPPKNPKCKHSLKDHHTIPSVPLYCCKKVPFNPCSKIVSSDLEQHLPQTSCGLETATLCSEIRSYNCPFLARQKASIPAPVNKLNWKPKSQITLTADKTAHVTLLQRTHT